MQNKLIKFSTTTQWLGKPTKALDAQGEPLLDKNKRQILLYKGKKVYIAYQWENYEGSYPEVFDLITVTGLPIAPTLIDEADGHKIDANFLSHSLLMVDIDSGMTIAELLADDLYNEFGSGYYTTASHTEESPRFRVIFVLETDITLATDMRLLYRWFLTYYKNADTSCKDATRLFYGSINATSSEITERYLPEAFVIRAIEEQKSLEQQMSQIKDYSETKDYPELSDNRKARILELLQQIPTLGHGYHSTFLAIGWGLQSAGYSAYDFVMVARQLFPHKPIEMCQEIWANPPKDGSNIGASINLIKKYHGNDCLKGY